MVTFKFYQYAYLILNVMLMLNSSTIISSYNLEDLPHSILIRAYFKYPSNYLATKKIVQSIANELFEKITEHHSEEEYAPEIKCDTMKYRRRGPKLKQSEETSEIELNKDEVNILISFNEGKTFTLLASSDINMKEYYFEYLQTGLGRSAKQDLVSKTLHKITELLAKYRVS